MEVEVVFTGTIADGNCPRNIEIPAGSGIGTTAVVAVNDVGFDKPAKFEAVLVDER